jgi:hypothetical protein
VACPGFRDSPGTLPRPIHSNLTIMKERSTRLLAALALLVVGLACHDVSDPTDPGIRRVTPVLRPLQALPEASVSLPAVSDAQVPLPTYTDPILAEVTISGLTSMTSHDSSYYVHYAGPIDGAGIHNSSGNAQCSMSAQISYPIPGRVGLGGSGAGVCTNPPQQRPTWTGTMILQGAGVALRGPGVLEPTYQCGASECHTYSGQQTVVVRPLAVAINTLTPGSQSAGPKTIMVPQPGIWTLFRASSTPDTINGYEVPVKAISWNWVPDSAPARSTVPCTNAQKLCSAYIIETGRMELTAQVNGVEQVDIVTVVSDQVVLQPAKMQMPPSIRTPARNAPSKQAITVSVVSATGEIRRNRDVLLGLASTDNTAGHMHGADGKPAGDLDSLQVNTGSSGVTTVTFTAPDPSGPVDVLASSTGASSAKVTIDVGILGLVALGTGTNYDLTGDKPKHPSNHWATSSHIASLMNLANRYYAQFGSKLTFNDTSLPLGGLYDVGGAPWATPHKGHREGLQTDVRTNGLTGPQMVFLRRNWRSITGIAVYDETATSEPHYHLPTAN